MKSPPGHWQRLSDVIWPPGSGHVAAYAWQHKIIKMVVLRSKAVMQDGRIFTHVSLSRTDRLPTWEEVGKVRDEFIGENVPAMHVVPAKKDYVNVHNFCLHLWAHPDSSYAPNLQELEREDAY